MFEPPDSASSLFRLAHSIVRRYSDSPLYCSWCFARKFEDYPDYDRSLASHLLTRNAASGTFESLGHRAERESIEINESTTLAPTPGTITEFVPPKTDATGKQVAPARRKTICGECGEIDEHRDDFRSKWMIETSVENIADNIENEHPFGDRHFDRSAAIEWAKTQTDYRSLQGKDDLVLVTAVYRGLRALSEPLPTPDPRSPPSVKSR